jgi:hypothetical protein
VFDMQSWQWTVCVVVAVIAVGSMSFAVARSFTRRASARATLRKATRVESALFGGTVPEEAHVFDGWAYRMGARFAGRVRVVVYEDRVAVSGPRVPRSLFEAWFWVQSLLLALVFPLLVAAIVALEWRWLIVAVVTFLLSFGISFGGAGLWPGLGEVLHEKGFFKALEFARSSVREVDVGQGWSKGGFGFPLFPYKRAIDRMAEGLAVSFFAPDEDGREVRFAIDLYLPEVACELADLLTQRAQSK